MKNTLSDMKGESSDQTAPGFDQAIIAAREDIFDRILVAGIIVAVISIPIQVLSYRSLNDFGAYLIDSFLYLAMLGIFYFLRRQQDAWSLKVRSTIFLVVIYAAAVINIFIWGIGGSGGVLLVLVPSVAILFLGTRMGTPATVVSIVTWLGIGLFFTIYPLEVLPPQNQNYLDWLFMGINILLAVIILVQMQQQFRETQDFVVTVADQKRDLLDTRAELLKSTKQLDYERYLLHTLLDTVSDRIFFKDLSGRYTRVSQAVASLYNILPSHVIGKTDFDFFASEYASVIQAEERQMLQTGEAVLDKVEEEIWRDGRPNTWAIKSRMPLKGDDGKIIGWFGTARDITEIKKAQEADKRHAQQLSAMAELGRAVTSSLELQTLVRVLVELLQQSFNYYGVNVWLTTDDNDAVFLVAGFSPAGDDLSVSDIRFPLNSDNAVAQVCGSGQYRLDNQIETAHDCVLCEIFPDVHSQLIQPLQVGEKIIGALQILSTQEGTFREDDVILLRSLADQVTIAIRNATLYKAEQNRRLFAETLYEIGRALSSTLNLHDVLDLILKQMDTIVPCDRASLLFLEEGSLITMASLGFPAGSGSGISVAVRDGDVFDQICRSQRPLSIADVTQISEGWQQSPNLPLARSWLGVPLIHSDQVVGMLSLVREAVNPYTISEVTLAATFAGQASLALENARLYDKLERFNQQLEEMVEERTEQLRKAYDQLERLDRTKSDFIQVTSHELRTPLTVIRGYSQMMAQDSNVVQNAMLLQLANGIFSGAARMHEIVNSMLDIAKIDSSALHLSTEPLALEFLVRNVASNFEIIAKQRKLSLVIDSMDELPSIDADPEALGKVFHHLISNAIKYTPDGGRIMVSGRYDDTVDAEFPDGSVVLSVKDTGIGIDMDHQELVFTKFYQTGEVATHSSGKYKFKGGGPGLGLPIARGIVQAHQGKLWIESPGHDEVNYPGSTFYVRLPLRQRPQRSLN